MPSYCSDGHDEVSSGVPGAYNISRRQTQKAISLPSSPNEFRGHASDISGVSDFLSTEDLISTWNKVLKSSPYWNKPLLPFQEWNIEYSELTVGTRVGIGK